MSLPRASTLTLVLFLSALWPAAGVHAQCPNCAPPSEAPVDVAPAPAMPTDTCSTCAGKCKNEHHCPKYVFTQEKMPCIKFCRVCSKPIIEPCTVAEDPGYGYYPTCWRPMGPLNYTHCTVPPPAILAQPPQKKPATNVVPEKQPEEEGAPPPNRVGLSLPEPR